MQCWFASSASSSLLPITTVWDIDVVVVVVVVVSFIVLGMMWCGGVDELVFFEALIKIIIEAHITLLCQIMLKTNLDCKV